MLCGVQYAKFKSIPWFVTGVALGIFLSAAHGVWADKPSGNLAGKNLPWADARLLAEVLERVKQDYVDSVDDHQLLQAAVRGMVASLDPHSAFLDNAEYDEIKISSSGEYSGVGIEVSMEDNAVVVIAPMDGTPAAQAGIRPGDVIIGIDGTPVDTASVADAIQRMRGKEGTLVRVSVARDGVKEPLEFTLKRTRVELHSVREELPESGLGYVQISQFSETTGDDLHGALQALKKRNAERPLRGLVLDLRNNPGGVLEAAVAVADEFLDKGIIVTANGRTPESKFEMDATPGDALNGAPIVVLVNGGSASAAEIVAGALKDNGRAVLMGRKTFGKGSVQTVVPLSDGRAIKLTTSRYFTPSGASINHKGIIPDIILDRDADADNATSKSGAPAPEHDAEVKRALQELKHGTAMRTVSLH
jgi:carboxyl-terminal processing protease